MSGPMKHAGAGWLISSMRVPVLSTLGHDVADILGQVFGGIYHLDYRSTLRKPDWANSEWITVRLQHRELATYDFNELTTLVIACHERAVRLAIHACAPGVLELEFSPRSHTAKSVFERHPTIEQAVQSYNEVLALGRPGEDAKEGG